MVHRIPILVACVWLAGFAIAAPPDRLAPSGGARGEMVISLQLFWDGESPMPAGVLVACRAQVLPLWSKGANGQAMEGSVVVRGGGRRCALEIPLAWQGGVAPATVVVNYEMDWISAGGSLVRRTGSLTAAVPAENDSALRLTVAM